MLVVRRGRMSNARRVGEVSLVVVLPAMVEVVEDGAEPPCLRSLFEDRRHVVCRDRDCPGGSQRPHAFVPSAVSSSVGAHRDDASVLDRGRPVVVVVVRHERIVFGVNDEEREFHLAKF